MLFVFGGLAAILSPGAVLGDDTFQRALSLATEERYPEAREVLDLLLLREPGNPRVRLLHGVLRAREGRIGESIVIFEELRRDYPNMSEAHNNLAVLYAVEGRLDDARTILLEALERQPDATAYATLGDVYTKLARRAYQRARELESGGDAGSGQETHTAVSTPATSDGSSEAGMPGTMTKRARAASGSSQPQEAAMASPAMQSRDALAKPPEVEQEPAHPAPQRRELARTSQDTASETEDSAALSPAVAADTQVPDAGSGDTGDAAAGTVSAASEAASTPASFCAYAGGFSGRRAVADAASWLRSYGAEVVEVRREERRIAGSYQVYLPPFETQREAVAKLREIRKRGVRDVAVIQDGDLANGISFGVYRKAGNMRRRVAALDKLGYAVRSQAAAVEVVDEYAIKAQASGAPATLDAAWTKQYPRQSIRVVDCG